MPITLKDISRLSGVSTSTVSYVLSGQGDAMKISTATQQKIREVARNHNYRANRLAKSLRRQTTRTIGVVMNELSSSWANQIMMGVDEILLPAGYQPLIGITMFGRQREEKLINSFLELQVEGLLVQPVATSGAFYRSLAALAETPVAFFGDAIAGVSIKPFMLDAVQAGRDQIDLLYRLGHRRISCITTDYDSPQSCGRREGALARMKELGLPQPESYLRSTRTMSPESDRNIVAELLALPEPPTALAVFCDYIAFYMLGALRTAGRDDIAVVGCGDLPESATELISLSTITEPRKEIGRLAADYLLKQMTSPAAKDDGIPVLCRGEVIERGSTAGKGTESR